MAGNGSYQYLTRPSLLLVMHQLPVKCHTLLNYNTNKWVIAQNISTFPKSQDCQGVESSHSNNCSVKEYTEDPTEGSNLLRASETN